MKLLRIIFNDPRASFSCISCISLARRYALFICARAARTGRAVPQRADNCVTRRNTATDPDALAAEPFRPKTQDVQRNTAMHY